MTPAEVKKASELLAKLTGLRYYASRFSTLRTNDLAICEGKSDGYGTGYKVVLELKECTRQAIGDAIDLELQSLNDELIKLGVKDEDVLPNDTVREDKKRAFFSSRK